MSVLETAIVTTDAIAVCALSIKVLWLSSDIAKLKKDKTPPWTPKVDLNMCACKHGANYHDATGCHYRTVDGRVTKLDSYGDPVKWEDLDCVCRRFVGPNSAYDPGLEADLARAELAAKPKLEKK